jgi:pantoate kinase
MDDEKIKELAQATGLSEEETKQKVDKTESALDMGASMIIAAIETEIKTKLTDEQKEHIKMAYKMSLMFTIMGMK